MLSSKYAEMHPISLDLIIIQHLLVGGGILSRGSGGNNISGGSVVCNWGTSIDNRDRGRSTVLRHRSVSNNSGLVMVVVVMVVLLSQAINESCQKNSICNL